MTAPIARYELDPTGTSPDNYVLNEPVALTNGALRVFVPQQGAYFDGSMILVDVATGKTLTKDQYYPSQAATIPSAKYGKGIYYCVVITDAAVSQNISSSYQALGGEWAYSNSALAAMIERLLTDTRTVPWTDVTGKPLYFNPAPHLQSSGDLYGMEYVVESLYAIRNAINLDNYSLIASIVDRLRTIESNGTTATEELRTSLTTAINDLVTIINTKIGGSGDSLDVLALAIKTEVAARVLGVGIAGNRIDDIVAKNYIPDTDKTSLENTGADAFFNSSAKVLTPLGGLNLMQKHLLSPSTDNQLSFVNGGLYLGSVAPVDVAALYVDAVDGDDNNPGTAALPMQTIRAVVDKGPPNVDRTIYLHEGQDHVVSPVHPARMRGGKWTIVPYGPLSTLLPPVPGNNVWRQIAARNLNTTIKSSAYTSAFSGGVSTQRGHAFYPDYGATVSIYAVTLVCGSPNTSTDTISTFDGSFHYVYGNGQWRLLNCEVQLPNTRSRFISTSKSADISLSLYASTISGPGKLASANNKYFTLNFEGGSFTDTDVTADELIAYLLNWDVSALQFSNFNTNLVPSTTLAPYATDADITTAISKIFGTSGATYVNVSASRNLNTLYTNTTGKIIHVLVSIDMNGISGLQLEVGTGIEWSNGPGSATGSRSMGWIRGTIINDQNAPAELGVYYQQQSVGGFVLPNEKYGIFQVGSGTGTAATISSWQELK